MLSVKVKGSTAKIEAFLSKNKDYSPILHKYGQRGVDVLRAATPVDTGETASKWRYKIVKTKTGLSLQWLNDAVADDGSVPIVVLLIHGHGTQNGSYVEANNFVAPAIKPVLNELARQLMKEVE